MPKSGLNNLNSVTNAKSKNLNTFSSIDTGVGELINLNNKYCLELYF